MLGDYIFGLGQGREDVVEILEPFIWLYVLIRVSSHGLFLELNLNLLAQVLDLFGFGKLDVLKLVHLCHFELLGLLLFLLGFIV